MVKPCAPIQRQPLLGIYVTRPLVWQGEATSTFHMAVPRISVITVTYNAASVMRRTLDSVAAQTLDDFEYIVIDGGSTDGTLDLIRAAGGLIDQWISETDRGIYDAMNKGGHRARGDYLYFLNAGDTFCHAEVLQNALSHLSNDPALLVGRVAVTGGRAAHYPVGLETLSGAGPRELFAAHFCHQALMVRRQDWLRSGGFSLDFPHFADFFSAMAVMTSGNVVFAPDLVLANFPLDGVSSNWGSSVVLYREREIIMSRLGFPEGLLGYYIGICRAYLYMIKIKVFGL